MGITEEYFRFIIATLESTLSKEKQLKIHFTSLDQDKKGYINYNEFSQLLEESKVKFLPESVKIKVFKSID